MSECVVPQMPGGRRRVEGLQLETEPKNKEMDILKNLPSFDSENFSKFLSHGSSSCSGKNGSVSGLNWSKYYNHCHLPQQHLKRYVKLKKHSDLDVKPQGQYW